MVGLIILQKSRKEILGILLGSASLLLGLFSFIYDSTYLRLTQLIDITGMLIFVLTLIFIAQSDILELTLKRYLTYVIPLLMILILGTYYIGTQSGNIIFGALILIYIGLEIYCFKKKNHADYKNLIIGAALVALGFGIWLLDTTRTVCFEFGLLNGRSIFHFLTAITIHQIYLFYSSQKLTLKLK